LEFAKTQAQSFLQLAEIIEVKCGLIRVKIGQNVQMPKNQDITSVGFKSPSGTDLAVEVMTIVDLRRRAPAEHFNKLQRANFYRLFGVLEGHTTPMVDFANYAVHAGDWLLVRPGQVFQYDFSSAWNGWLMVFPPESLSAMGAKHAEEDFGMLQRVEDLACVCALLDEEHKWMTQSIQQMQHDADLNANTALRNALLRLALASTLLRLSMWQSPQPDGGESSGAGHSHFRRFRKLLEVHFASQHQVQHYASNLGMSEKTLSRMCIAAVGVPAKVVINQRLILEAKRLLAHTTLPVQSIGSALGFDEATNFVKFFRKATGTTPLTFRQPNLKPIL
jgi:AraC-like DNA-binding protein